jgi:hypothetical protein
MEETITCHSRYSIFHRFESSRSCSLEMAANCGNQSPAIVNPFRRRCEIREIRAWSARARAHTHTHTHTHTHVYVYNEPISCFACVPSLYLKRSIYARFIPERESENTSTRIKVYHAIIPRKRVSRLLVSTQKVPGGRERFREQRYTALPRHRHKVHGERVFALT